MELERLQLLVPMVSVDFIAYASNTTADSVNSMLAGSPLNPQVTLVINELKALIDTQFPNGDTETDGVYNVNEHLRMLNLSSLLGSQYQGNSIGNALRVMAGGTLPLSSGSTTLEQEIGKLARDIYPILLLPRDDGSHFLDFMNISSMIIPSVMRNSYEPFFDAVEADDVLNGLYVAQGQNRHFKNFNYWLNTGSGTGQQLISLPSELIIPAYYKVQIEGKLTPEDFISQVIENLQLFRRMANNETVEVPAYVAINGVSLPENVELQLPWGTLRNPTSTELNLLSQRSQMINSVLVIPFKLKMKKSSNNSMSSPYPFPQDRARENVDEAAMLTFATIMISLGKEIRTDNVGTIILPNFGHSPSTSWMFEKPGAANHTLSSADRTKITRISGKLETYKKHLSIALRRNLMAINRLDTLDGFIDSIIAMESLFGSERETTFTVSSAMAKFLKSDAEQKLELKKEIGKLYNERSKIIHGASFPAPQTIEVKRQRVIDLNIEVLRKLLYRRNDLIDCASNERSTKILLT
ncbi:MAG: HEPN domain-containing protein [Herbinix sp.]|nr:HEPN domain-containing protein [Herbinix sp.]